MLNSPADSRSSIEHPEGANERKPLVMPTFAVWIAIAYTAWFITNPIYSPRFGFIAAAGFEKVLAGTFIIAALSQGRITNLFRAVPTLLLLLFIWMMICASVSPYGSLASMEHWWESYWKKLVFFACLTISIQNRQQLKVYIFGVATVLFLYQLYTWFDFARGGAYVYQQGMKRMCAVWNDGGYGAGTGWGMLGMWGVPTAIYCLQTSQQRSYKIVSATFFTSTFFCILLSGARGALISSVVYLVIAFRRHIWKPKYVLLIVVLFVIGYPMLPEAVQHRFESLVVEIEEFEMTKADMTAKDSADGRLAGLFAGFGIASRSPIFGCGPAASAQAAYDLSPETKSGVPMQLHNLYGQVAAELGFVGIAIWLTLVAATLFPLVNGIRSQNHPVTEGHTSDANRNMEYLLGSALVMLVYGMAGHTLYDYRWLIIFALANALFCFEDSEEPERLFTNSSDRSH